MSVTGVARLFSTKPHHEVGSDGRMALSDHFRELRGRLLRCVVAFIVAFVAAIYFHDQILALVTDPYEQAQQTLDPGVTEQTINGAAGSFIVYLKLCGLAAAVATAPYWLYQIWAFLLPGLKRNEKKWTAIFVVIAGPLFLAGVALGYVTLPKGLEVLIGFTPEGMTNLVEFNDYLTFFSRTLLVFGIALELPLFVVMLNLAGVVSGKSLGAHRAWIIIGIFVFAAIATPSTDPFTMTFMAVPMCVLFLVAEVIARINDRRRSRGGKYAGLSPDEASPLDL